MSEMPEQHHTWDGGLDLWLPIARAAAVAAGQASAPLPADLAPVPASAPSAPPAPAPVEAGECAAWAGACPDPVFVLTAGRSGSTLLRFLLDAHPDLACPPETELPSVCNQLAAVWSLFATSTWPGKQGTGAPPMAEPVIAGLRHLLDLMIGPYLARRGKRRYCDKSLGSARHAGLLAQLYPQARFVCLYRHPMDLIASGLEACPWGLNSYGFEHYIGASPGNAVAAIARYWADHTTAILAAEDQFPGQCHRVRYEDLVASPETVAAEIFAFLGLPPVPSIAARFLSPERERFGRSDFKIWNTAQISTASVGRGWSIPPTLISPPLEGTVNELAERLGYRQIDQTWGTKGRPADMLATANGHTPDGGPVPPDQVMAALPVSPLLDQRIKVGLARTDHSFGRRWHPHSTDRFRLVATTPQGPSRDTSWLVDLPARTVTTGHGHDDDDTAWCTTGPTAVWEQAINGAINLGVAFRHGQMRYADHGPGPGTVTADTRVAMMAELLGITTPPPGQDPPDGR